MNRKVDPKTNVPTVATLATAFLGALLNWAIASLPASIPVEVTATGHVLATAVLAVAVGKLAQHFTWAQDSVDTIMDAEAVLGAAERGEHG